VSGGRWPAEYRYALKGDVLQIVFPEGTGWTVVGYPEEREPRAEVQIRDWEWLSRAGQPAEQVAQPTAGRFCSYAGSSDPQAAIAVR